MQAAIGCAQLERIGELVAGKRRVFNYYRTGLEGLPLRMNPEPPGTINGFWMPTIVADGAAFDRQALMTELRRQNIDARVFFWPLTMTPPFQRACDHPVAYGTFARAINLPSYYDLTDEQMDRVLQIVRRSIIDEPL